MSDEALRTVAARLPDSWIRAIDDAAEAAGLDRSAYLRQVIRKGVPGLGGRRS